MIIVDLKKKYIVNKNQKVVAVLIDIRDFNKLEEVLEDFALSKFMDATNEDEKYTPKEAQGFYKAVCEIK